VRRHAARPIEPPQLVPHLIETLRIAKEEAQRNAHTAVERDDVFFAMLRQEQALPVGALQAAGTDMVRFKRSIEAYLTPVETSAPGADVPLSPDVEALIGAAKRTLESRRRTNLNTLSILEQLIADESGIAARLIAAAGGSLATLREHLARV
jgi:ATP-dependent Clp protease ATP-binding subunit ClpA